MTAAASLGTGGLETGIYPDPQYVNSGASPPSSPCATNARVKFHFLRGFQGIGNGSILKSSQVRKAGLSPLLVFRYDHLNLSPSPPAHGLPRM